MKHPEQPTPYLFVDDGFPESREYADNYVALADESPRSWLHVLFGKRPAGPRRPTTDRILSRRNGRTPTAA